MCADSSCVDSPYKCPKSGASSEVVHLRFDADFLMSHTVNFAFSNTEPVARLRLTTGFMVVPQQSIQTRKGIQPITFYPVPTNETDAVANMVPTGMVNYLRNKIQISGDGLISPASTLISPAFFVTNLN